MTRLLLADRVKGRADSFLAPLMPALDRHYETRFLTAGPGDELAEAIRWADIVWLEWCWDHAVWATRQAIPVGKPCIVRLHSIEALQTHYPAAMDWARVTRLVTVADLTAESESLTILLQAMAKIPGAELVVAGGPDREDLRADLAYRRLARLSDTLDLHGRVFFAGQVTGRALPPLLRSADLMVNVNQHEASAVTSIQAMACGTPVVAAANGAHLDAVVDGTTGILVEPLRPALLAQKIRALLAHPMQLEAFSVAATDRARSRYSWDRIAHETLAVYDTALAA